MVVDEQQRLSEQLRLQSSKVHEATASASQAQEELSASLSLLQQEQDKCCRLEEQLRDQASRHHADADAMTTKLSLEDAHNRALRQKMSALSRTLDELQENNKTLRRAEEELLELRDKISRGECGPTCGSSSLVSELEELRKRVLEMEGKDEELVRMEDHCRDLNKKLQKESVQAQNLKAEVDKLNGRIMDLEKLEDAFSKSKQECGALKGSLDKERTVSKLLLGELETLRGRVRELEEAETQLAQSETGLKEDLCKLKTLTVMLVDERKAAGEKLKQMENRVHSSTGKLQAEQDKVTTVTERLIEESRKALRSKAELEERVCGAVRERDDLRTQLSNEEQRSADLESKISLMKRRLQALETVEREYLRNKASENIKGPVTNRFQQEDNKVKELTQEVERLRSKLKDLKAVEGDSFKTEEFELLEKRFASEQEKAKTLMEELEISKKELSKYQLAEKKECNQETVLYKRLKEEEAKASHLSREVAALKEKVHEYMGTEDSMCRMKSDHSGLQRRLTQQEVRNKELSREMEGLTRELERYRRFSKSLRPGMNGRRFSDLHVATKEVQTVPEDFLQQAMVPLECAVVNGKLYDGHEESAVFSNGLQSDKHTLNKVNERTSSARRARTSNDLPRQNSGGDVVWSPGQPLTIKVTPDHGHTTAMLEISSPTSDPPASFTSTAVIPTTGAPAKPRITIIQSASPAHPRCRAPDEPLSPDRSDSPFSGPTTPERAASPLENTTTAAANTTTATTTATATTTMGPGHAFFRVQRSDSQGSNVITAEDNKIHIHLGPQFLQERRTLGSCGAVSTPPMSPVRGSGKITSSLVIKPSSSPVQRPAQVTVSNAFN
ncbi:unnamed protein product [Knipowitschia caucasica]